LRHPDKDSAIEKNERRKRLFRPSLQSKWGSQFFELGLEESETFEAGNLADFFESYNSVPKTVHRFKLDSKSDFYLETIREMR
jgi:hypothetical protein